jgi:MFS transporter, DHA1 family, tetracycline resistance protein
MKSKKITLGIIEWIVSLKSIGFSIVLPLLPFIVSKYIPSQKVVVGMSALMSVFAACTFFAAPVFGALSVEAGLLDYIWPGRLQLSYTTKKQALNFGFWWSI